MNHLQYKHKTRCLLRQWNFLGSSRISLSVVWNLDLTLEVPTIAFFCTYICQKFPMLCIFHAMPVMSNPGCCQKVPCSDKNKGKPSVSQKEHRLKCSMFGTDSAILAYNGIVDKYGKLKEVMDMELTFKCQDMQGWSLLYLFHNSCLLVLWSWRKMLAALTPRLDMCYIRVM